MDALFGGMPDAARFIFAFAVVLGLIIAGALLWRRFGGGPLSALGSRGRQPRLSVIEAAAIDTRRRLVLVRRDNTEHLLMIGGPSDLVIEPNINRNAPAIASRDARGAASAADLRPSPLDANFEPSARVARPLEPAPLPPAPTDWQEARPGEPPIPALPSLPVETARPGRSELGLRLAASVASDRLAAAAPDADSTHEANHAPPLSLEQALRGSNVPDSGRAPAVLAPIPEPILPLTPDPRRAGLPIPEPSLQPMSDPRRASAAITQEPPLQPAPDLRRVAASPSSESPLQPAPEPRRWTVPPIPTIPEPTLQAAPEPRRAVVPAMPSSVQEPTLQAAPEPPRPEPPPRPVAATILTPLPEPASQAVPDPRRTAASTPAPAPAATFEPVFQTARSAEPRRIMPRATPRATLDSAAAAPPEPAIPAVPPKPAAIPEPTLRSPVFQSTLAAKRNEASPVGPPRSDESSLAEMAQRLEAALRRPTRAVEAPAPAEQSASATQLRPIGRSESVPSRTTRLAAQSETATPQAGVPPAAEQPPAVKENPATERSAQRGPFESLEEEMASLLGRSTGKT